MNARELIAGLPARPIPDRRSRYTPPGVRVVNETWAAVAVCCQPECGWQWTKGATDPAITARNHAELHGHQTLVAWYAADRYLPDPSTAEMASPRPGTVSPSFSDYQGRHDARLHPTNSRKTHEDRSTK